MNSTTTAFRNSADITAKLASDANFMATVAVAAECIGDALAAGGTLLIAGNGGSAAEAQHFAAEIVGRYIHERRGYPAIALTTDTSILTAVGNDYSFDAIFSRQVSALGKPGDVFVGLSTSGNSQNIIAAIQAARTNGLKTISLIGKDGGKMWGLAEIDIVVPSNETPRIQEIHLLIIHTICDYLDIKLS